MLRTAAQFFHELQAKYQRFGRQNLNLKSDTARALLLCAGVHSSGESLAEKASVASTTSSEVRIT